MAGSPFESGRGTLIPTHTRRPPMAFAPIKLQSIEYHPDAKCSDCTWSAATGPAARARGKEHVRATGHTVVVTLTKASAWGKR